MAWIRRDGSADFLRTVSSSRNRLQTGAVKARLGVRWMEMIVPVQSEVINKITGVKLISALPSRNKKRLIAEISTSTLSPY